MNRNYKEPLFVRYFNGEIGTLEMLNSFSMMTSDKYSLAAIEEACKNPPDLSQFKGEFKDAVIDIVGKGIDEAFKCFVNHYMQDALEEDIITSKNSLGDNISRTARIKSDEAPWLEALICYNLSLYIRAFGLDNLKMCRICKKLFTNKGPYAVYCSDPCKQTGKRNPADKAPRISPPMP